MENERVLPLRLFLIALTIATAALPARGGGGRFSIAAYGAITTSSKLFEHPNARDELIRGLYTPIDPVYGAGIDARTDIPAFGLRFGLGADVLTRTVSSSAPYTSPPVPIEDGYVAVPVELTAYFSIPVGGEKVDFYLGGGGGVYFGERRYTYAGVRAVTIDRNIQPGIHVLTGVEYALGDALALRSELKFRNVQLETTQRFPVTSTIYEGVTIPLPQDPFTSRVQIDGMNVSLGIVVRLP
jgi:opacity protein-like surface antigen